MYTPFERGKRRNKKNRRRKDDNLNQIAFNNKEMKITKMKTYTKQ